MGLVDFWYYKWVLDEPLATRLMVPDPPHFFVADFYMNYGWDVSYLKGFLVIDLVNTISKLCLDLDQEDKIFWLPSSTGEFSITSAWSALRPRKDPIVIHQIVCWPILLLKLSFFAW